jgi:hypothetical protein
MDALQVDAEQHRREAEGEGADAALGEEQGPVADQRRRLWLTAAAYFNASVEKLLESSSWSPSEEPSLPS